MRPKILIYMAVLILLSIAMPAFAQEYPEPVTDIETFGYSDERQRHSYVYGIGFHGYMQHLKGPSYSQPLILNSGLIHSGGDKWEEGRLKDRRVAVSIEDNVAYGLLLPKTDEPPPAEPVELEELWSIKLSGNEPTKSDATYFEADNGRKYLFVGTYSPYINIIDITDFENAKPYKTKKCTYATDITSAPLVMKWKGHNILIASTGNTGNIVIITDPLKPESKEFYIKVGSGRTSSSPTPVDGGKGFAVGLDGAQGIMQVYYLDEILEEGPGGTVQQKSGTAHYQKNLPTGLPASFSSHGNKLYFGDKESRIYMFDTQTGKLDANNSHSAVGTFSNRSPALDVVNNQIIFPAVGRTGNGAVVAVNCETGNTEWVQNFSGRAQTSPIVVTESGITQVWEGTSDGWLVKINAENGERFSAESFTEKLNIDEYAQGISGQISAVGPFMLASTEKGVKGYWLADYMNFQTVDLDPGIPEGEKAQPGQTYQGTATFRYDEGFYPQAYGNIGIFYGDEYLTLNDENGDEIEKVDFSFLGGGTTHYIGIDKGKEVIVYFDWIAGNENTMTALINLNEYPVIQDYDEITIEDNKISITIPIDLENLKAQISECPVDARAGTKVNVIGTVINESGEPINTKIHWKVNGTIVDETEITIEDEKDVNLSFNMPDSDARVELEVNPGRNMPPDEMSWSDNKDSVTIDRLEDTSGGNSKLSFNPNPAKWWEMVTATLSPPKPTPPRGTITSWSISSAKLTYPKKHPDWTFGHPLDPVGTTTVNMSTGGHTSTVDFRQDWSNYGAEVYDVIDGRLIPGPTYYPISAEYKIDYTYKYKVRKCSGSGENRRCRTVTRTRSGSDSGTASAKILVDGTSRVPKAH